MSTGEVAPRKKRALSFKGVYCDTVNISGDSWSLSAGDEGVKNK
jgi:hypothetical protein